MFASFVSSVKEDSKRKNIFYKKILGKAKKNLRNYDLPYPTFRPIFEDIKIKTLGTNFYVTLKAGLWKSMG